MQAKNRQIQLELSRIHKSFSGTPVLRGLDLKLPGWSATDPSESELGKAPYVVLLGASGCGKSTTLRIIAGLDFPDSGQVRLGGLDVLAVPPHDRDVAMVFQNDGLLPHLRINQSLSLAVRRCLDPKNKRSQIARAIEMTKIEPLLDRYPDRLSGGERRRAAIAIAMARGAAIRLLDEPLAALDTAVRHALSVDLRRWHDTHPGLTVHVTHDGDEAMRIADVIAVMDDGVIAQVDTPVQIHDHPTTVKVAKAIGTPPINWMFANGKDDPMTLCDDQASTKFIVGIRPQRLRVDSQSRPYDHSILSVPVDRDSIRWCHVNESVHVTGRCGNQILTAVTPRETFVPTTELFFSVARKDLHRFDRVSGRRIVDDGNA